MSSSSSPPPFMLSFVYPPIVSGVIPSSFSSPLPIPPLPSPSLSISIELHFPSSFFHSTSPSSHSEVLLGHQLFLLIEEKFKAKIAAQNHSENDISTFGRLICCFDRIRGDIIFPSHFVSFVRNSHLHNKDFLEIVTNDNWKGNGKVINSEKGKDKGDSQRHSRPSSSSSSLSSSSSSSSHYDVDSEGLPVVSIPDADDAIENPTDEENEIITKENDNYLRRRRTSQRIQKEKQMRQEEEDEDDEEEEEEGEEDQYDENENISDLDFDEQFSDSHQWELNGNGQNDNDENPNGHDDNTNDDDGGDYEDETEETEYDSSITSDYSSLLSSSLPLFFVHFPPPSRPPRGVFFDDLSLYAQIRKYSNRIAMEEMLGALHTLPFPIDLDSLISLLHHILNDNDESRHDPLSLSLVSHCIHNVFSILQYEHKKYTPTLPIIDHQMLIAALLFITQSPFPHQLKIFVKLFHSNRKGRGGEKEEESISITNLQRLLRSLLIFPTLSLVDSHGELQTFQWIDNTANYIASNIIYNSKEKMKQKHHNDGDDNDIDIDDDSLYSSPPIHYSHVVEFANANPKVIIGGMVNQIIDRFHSKENEKKQKGKGTDKHNVTEQPSSLPSKTHSSSSSSSSSSLSPPIANVSPHHLASEYALSFTDRLHFPLRNGTILSLSPRWLSLFHSTTLLRSLDPNFIKFRFDKFVQKKMDKARKDKNNNSFQGVEKQEFQYILKDIVNTATSGISGNNDTNRQSPHTDSSDPFVLDENHQHLLFQNIFSFFIFGYSQLENMEVDHENQDDKKYIQQVNNMEKTITAVRNNNWSDIHCDPTDLLVGLVLCTSKSPEEKLKFIFAIFDSNEDNQISKSQLTKMIFTLFRLFLNPVEIDEFSLSSLFELVEFVREQTDEIFLLSDVQTDDEGEEAIAFQEFLFVMTSYKHLLPSVTLLKIVFGDTSESEGDKEKENENDHEVHNESETETHHHTQQSRKTPLSTISTFVGPDGQVFHDPLPLPFSVSSSEYAEFRQLKKQNDEEEKPMEKISFNDSLRIEGKQILTMGNNEKKKITHKTSKNTKTNVSPSKTDGKQDDTSSSSPPPSIRSHHPSSVLFSYLLFSPFSFSPSSPSFRSSSATRSVVLPIRVSTLQSYQILKSFFHLLSMDLIISHLKSKSKNHSHSPSNDEDDGNVHIDEEEFVNILMNLHQSQRKKDVYLTKEESSEYNREDDDEDEVVKYLLRSLFVMFSNPFDKEENEDADDDNDEKSFSPSLSSPSYHSHPLNISLFVLGISLLVTSSPSSCLSLLFYMCGSQPDSRHFKVSTDLPHCRVNSIQLSLIISTYLRMLFALNPSEWKGENVFNRAIMQNTQDIITLVTNDKKGKDKGNKKANGTKSPSSSPHQDEWSNDSTVSYAEFISMWNDHPLIAPFLQFVQQAEEHKREKETEMNQKRETEEGGEEQAAESNNENEQYEDENDDKNEAEDENDQTADDYEEDLMGTLPRPLTTPVVSPPSLTSSASTHLFSVKITPSHSLSITSSTVDNFIFLFSLCRKLTTEHIFEAFRPQNISSPSSSSSSHPPEDSNLKMDFQSFSNCLKQLFHSELSSLPPSSLLLFHSIVKKYWKFLLAKELTNRALSGGGGEEQHGDNDPIESIDVSYVIGSIHLLIPFPSSSDVHQKHSAPSSLSHYQLSSSIKFFFSLLSAVNAARSSSTSSSLLSSSIGPLSLSSLLASYLSLLFSLSSHVEIDDLSSPIVNIFNECVDLTTYEVFKSSPDTFSHRVMTSKHFMRFYENHNNNLPFIHVLHLLIKMAITEIQENDTIQQEGNEDEFPDQMDLKSPFEDSPSPSSSSSAFSPSQRGQNRPPPLFSPSPKSPKSFSSPHRPMSSPSSFLSPPSSTSSTSSLRPSTPSLSPLLFVLPLNDISIKVHTADLSSFRLLRSRLRGVSLSALLSILVDETSSHVESATGHVDLDFNLFYYFLDQKAFERVVGKILKLRDLSAEDDKILKSEETPSDSLCRIHIQNIFRILNFHMDGVVSAGHTALALSFILPSTSSHHHQSHFPSPSWLNQKLISAFSIIDLYDEKSIKTERIKDIFISLYSLLASLSSQTHRPEGIVKDKQGNGIPNKSNKMFSFSSFFQSHYAEIQSNIIQQAENQTKEFVQNWRKISSHSRKEHDPKEISLSDFLLVTSKHSELFGYFNVMDISDLDGDESKEKEISSAVRKSEIGEVWINPKNENLNGDHDDNDEDGDGDDTNDNYDIRASPPHESIPPSGIRYDDEEDDNDDDDDFDRRQSHGNNKGDHSFSSSLSSSSSSVSPAISLSDPSPFESLQSYSPPSDHLFTLTLRLSPSSEFPLYFGSKDLSLLRILREFGGLNEKSQSEIFSHLKEAADQFGEKIMKISKASFVSNMMKWGKSSLSPKESPNIQSLLTLYYSRLHSLFKPSESHFVDITELSIALGTIAKGEQTLKMAFAAKLIHTDGFNNNKIQQGNGKQFPPSSVYFFLRCLFLMVSSINSTLLAHFSDSHIQMIASKQTMETTKQMCEIFSLETEEKRRGMGNDNDNDQDDILLTVDKIFSFSPDLIPWMVVYEWVKSSEINEKEREREREKDRTLTDESPKKKESAKISSPVKSLVSPAKRLLNSPTTSNKSKGNVNSSVSVSPTIGQLKISPSKSPNRK